MSSCTSIHLALFVLASLNFRHGQSQNYSDALAVLDQLLVKTNYDTQIRPLVDQSKAMEVSIGFELVSIVEINDVTQSLTVNGFMFLQWIDEILKWNSSDYNGVSLLHPFPEKIWRPRMGLINTLGDRDLFGDSKSPMFLNEDGEVIWIPGSLFTASCNLDVTDFPYDRQTCNMTLVSLTLTKKEITFSTISRKIQTQFFITNGEWDMTSGTVVIGNVYIYDRELATLDLKFVVTRRSEFFTLNIIAPVILISLMNIFLFLIPAESGEKISYGITVSLALSVYLSAVSGILPRSSINAAKLSDYLLSMLIITLLAVFDSIIIILLFSMERRKKKHRTAVERHLSDISGSLKALIEDSTIMVYTEPLEDNSMSIRFVAPQPAQTVAPRTTPTTQDQNHNLSARYCSIDYKRVGKYLNRGSFILFLAVWSVLTASYLGTIKNAV